jgi:hypothetical protein
VDSKLPPIAVILNDPAHKEYTPLDFKLLKALKLKEQYMSGDFPVWIDRSDRVTFETKYFVSGSRAALERQQYQADKAAQNGKSTPSFGRMYYAVPRTKDGGDMPTMREWLEEQAEKRNSKVIGRPE